MHDGSCSLNQEFRGADVIDQGLHKATNQDAVLAMYDEAKLRISNRYYHL